MKRIKRPRCIHCGSLNVEFPGFCSYHWIPGKGWSVIKHSCEMADTDAFSCQDCGGHMCGDLTPPFNFVIEEKEIR